MDKEQNKKATVNTSATFAEQVDAVLSGNYPKGEAVLVKNETPFALRQVGLKNLPMLTTQKHLSDALHAKSEDNPHWHGLSLSVLKGLPNYFENPVMIMDSMSNNGSIVVVTDKVDNDNLPIIASIRPDGTGMYNKIDIESNFITGYYGKENFGNFLKNNLLNNTILYWDKEKSLSLLDSIQLQLPQALISLDFNTIIRKSRAFVNSQDKKNSNNNHYRALPEALNENTKKKEQKMKITERIKKFFGIKTKRDYEREMNFEFNREKARILSFESGQPYITIQESNLPEFSVGEVISLSEAEKILTEKNQSLKSARAGTFKTVFTIVSIYQDDFKGVDCVYRVGSENGGIANCIAANNDMQHYSKYLQKHLDLASMLDRAIKENLPIQEQFDVQGYILAVGKDLNASKHPENFEFPPLEIEHKEKVMASNSETNKHYHAFPEPSDQPESGETKAADGSASTQNSYRDKVLHIREQMVQTLIGYIEQNPTQWESGWNNLDGTAPENGKTGTAYRGINSLYLAFISMSKGYKDPRWVTFNQAKELGASVKKGEKSVPIIFFELYDRATKKAYDSRSVKNMTEEEKTEYVKENVYAVMKYSSVFNAAQCHNFPERNVESLKMSEEERANQNELIDTIIINSAAPVKYDGGNRAYYSPDSDTIHVPPLDAFTSMQDYYATVLHEIAHSTGHASRLNRDLSGRKGSEDYAKEELRAELACVFMQLEQGLKIDGKHITNHAAYLNGWLKAAKDDPKVFYEAARDAEKISDYVAEHYLQSVNANELELETDSINQNEGEHKEEMEKSLPNEQRSAQPPLVINLLAGPGAGKTTAALELTAALKKEGYNVEYVAEYAKELVLENKLDVLNNQEHVTDEQYHRLDRLRNSGVEIVVTDSPVLLGKIYGEGKMSAEYDKKIMEYYNSFDNFNLVVKRGETYQTEGRLETFVQAKVIDSKITDLLRSNNLFYGNYHHNEIEKTIDRINTTFNRLYGEKQMGEHKEKIDEKAGQPSNTLGEELAKKSTWLKIDLPDGAVGKEYGKTTLVKMPQGGEYSYFGIYVPTRFLKQLENGKWQLTVGDKLSYRLNNDGRQVELTGKELASSFAGEQIGKQPLRVAPSKRNAASLARLEQNVPKEMKTIPNWCVYRTKVNEEKGKRDKFVLSPLDGKWAKSNEPQRWTDFDTAMKYAKENGCEGLSFVLDGKSGITCIDLDKCIGDEGKYNELAAKLTSELKGTFTEKSVSGNGVHIFLKDDVLKNGKYKSTAITTGGDLEVYDTGHMISMTGDIISETNELGKCPTVTADFLRRTLGEKPKFNSDSHYNARSRYQSGNDREVVARIQKSKKGAEFDALYSGNGLTGNASVDDMTFANMLAFFTDCDKEQCMRIMREASTYRPDKPDSYYQHTIQKAVDTLSVRPTFGAARAASATRSSGNGADGAAH